MTKTSTNSLLSLGDVLRTHPLDGYWGCAIVLTVREKTEQFDPMCHIGITTAVFRHEYGFGEINPSNLTILQHDQEIRIAPYTYRPLGKETCIGIYSRKVTPAVAVIGSVDPSSIYPARLKFVAGDSTDGGWPFCGKIDSSLGYEAVHLWRAENDREAWLKDIAAAEKSHEEMLVRLKDKKGTQPANPARRRRRRG